MTKNHWKFILYIFVALMLLLVMMRYIRFPRQENVTAGNAGEQQANQMLEMREKPTPKVTDFHGCPPEGDGGDQVINRLKNRIDDGQYIAVRFNQIQQLHWPDKIEKRHRRHWSPKTAEEIARYEGLPIVVEAFIFNAKTMGPESANCHGVEKKNRDFHLWLTATADEDKARSIVAEVTPRVREGHAGWNLKALKELARTGNRVRVSGWLLLDPEHPEEVGKTRGTIWEIHPIMKIEVERGSGWISLDALSS